MHKTEKEQHEEAADDLRKAIALNPFVAEPRILLAQIYNVSGRYEEAESQAQVRSPSQRHHSFFRNSYCSRVRSLVLCAGNDGDNRKHCACCLSGERRGTRYRLG
jgi:protein involved in temperature-dependent protein secretion